MEELIICVIDIHIYKSKGYFQILLNKGDNKINS